MANRTCSEPLYRHLLATRQPFVTAAQISDFAGPNRPFTVKGEILPLTERGKLFKICEDGWLVRDERCMERFPELPEPKRYIDRLMSHLGLPYYFGFNSAAEEYGAAHFMFFSDTIVVPRGCPRHRTFSEVRNARELVGADMGRWINYAERDDVADRKTKRRKMAEEYYGPDTYINYSTPETTVLDMVEDPRHADGLDQAANVSLGLIELAKLDPEELALQALKYPVHIRQRLGHLIDASLKGRMLLVKNETSGLVEEVPETFDTAPLLATIPTKSRTARLFKDCRRDITMMDRGMRIIKDRKWNIKVNTKIWLDV